MPLTYTDKLLEHFRSVFDAEASGRLIPYAPLVGLVAGIGAAAFCYVLSFTQAFAPGHIEGYYPPPAGHEPVEHVIHLATHWWAVLLVPALGGLVRGLLVYTLAPEAEGHGTDAIVRAFHRLGRRIRARVPFVKSIASIVIIGTGGSAGREGPIAQIGAGLVSFLPEKLGLAEQERRLLMLSGRAGDIGAVFRAPLGGALFVSELFFGSTALFKSWMYELTDDYRIILPIMAASGLSSIIAEFVDRDSIYLKKLSRRGESITRGHDLHGLEHVMVRDVMVREFPIVRNTDDLSEIVRVARANSHIESLPVLNDNGQLVGIIQPEDLHRALESEVAPQLVNAEDIALKSPVSVSPDENLLEALGDFGFRDMDTLPVENGKGSSRTLIGLLLRADVMRRYRKEVLHKR